MQQHLGPPRHDSLQSLLLVQESQGPVTLEERVQLGGPRPSPAILHHLHQHLPPASSELMDKGIPI
eukprot:6148203-Amphidinium_carterae.1